MSAELDKVVAELMNFAGTLVVANCDALRAVIADPLRRVDGEAQRVAWVALQDAIRAALTRADAAPAGHRLVPAARVEKTLVGPRSQRWNARVVRKKAEGLKLLRNFWAKPEHEERIRKYADRLSRSKA